MAFMKTYAFTRGTWDGEIGNSNFVQDPEVFATVEEFLADYTQDADIIELVGEYVLSGDLIANQKELSADGKVLIFTKEYFDESSWGSFRADARWASENEATKIYDVEVPAAPEDVGTFDEGNRIYYHSSANLF